jgi:hypothetical protein
MKALVIPSLADKPCKVVYLDPNDLRAMQALVGGYIEEARYDHDSVFVLNEEGGAMRLARNRRATDYVRRHSDAARQGRIGPMTPGYGLVGDVVVFGESDGQLTDVPQRLVEHFGADQPLGQPGLEL